MNRLAKILIGFGGIAITMSPGSVSAQMRPGCFMETPDGIVVDLGYLCPSEGGRQAADARRNSKFSSSMLTRPKLTTEKVEIISKGFSGKYAKLYCDGREAGLSYDEASRSAYNQINPEMLSMLNQYENGTEFWDQVNFGTMMSERAQRLCPQY